MRTLSLERLREPDATLDDARISAVSGDQAVDRIVLWLDSVLDDSYLLLRNLELPGAQAAVDMLVIGPSGIWALYVEAEPGQYKTEAGRFYGWETQAAGYVLISPNPLLILKSTLSQLRRWLKDHRLPPECARSAILFTDPAAVVHSADQDVWLVSPKLVESYPVEMAREPAVLEPDAVERAAFAIARGELPQAPPILAEPEPGAPGRAGFLGFSPRQWIVLGILAFLDVAVLGGFLVYALLINQ
jgi:hypothetical protein